jgi:hypothetical protein
MLLLIAISLALLGADARLDPARAEAAQGYAHGVFVATPHGPIELTAFAEVTRNGQLRMAKGSLENVPTLSEVRGILCNLPSWRPGSVFIATDLIFRDERAERREIKFAVRQRNISAIEMKVEDVERPDRLASLIRAVGGSEEAHAYVFIVLVTNGLERLYPFRVKIEQGL